MTSDYLRFWRYFPRFTFGILFTFEIFVLLFGKDESIKAITNAMSFGYKNYGGFALGVLVIFFLIIVATLGLFFLDMLISSLASLLRYFTKLGLFDRLFLRPNIAVLLLPDFELAFYLFEKDHDQLMEFQELRGVSEPDTIKFKKEIKELESQIKEHIMKIKNKEMATLLSYFAAITQEQRFADYLKWDVMQIYYLWIVLICAFISLLCIGCTSFVAIAWLIISLFIILCTVPLLIYRKLRLAYYLIFSYVDSFVFGESPEIADRETM